MPYKKSYNKKTTNPRYQKTSYSSCLAMVKSDANFAMGLANTLKPYLGLNTEYKHCDVNVSQAPDNAGGLTHVTQIAQGDDYDNREGRQVRARSFAVRGDVEMNGSATFSQIRVLWFIWKDDTAPTVTDVLDAANVNAFLNLDKSDKYRILRDRYFTVNSDTPQKTFKFFTRLRHKIKFDGTASSDYEHGSMWILYISDESVNTPTVTFRHRTRFVDN